MPERAKKKRMNEDELNVPSDTADENIIDDEEVFDPGEYDIDNEFEV